MFILKMILKEGGMINNARYLIKMTQQFADTTMADPGLPKQTTMILIISFLSPYYRYSVCLFVRE